MDEDLTTAIQKARLFSLIRHLAVQIEQDQDEAILLGVGLGLRYAAQHPIEAANLLDELNPPVFEGPLHWVVYGPTEADPQQPVN